MSTTTPILGLRVAEQTDSPVEIELVLGELADDMDTKGVPRFTNTTARDAAITSPIAGQMCYVTSAGAGSKQLQLYNGSAWELIPRQIYRTKAADETVSSSTTLQNDDHLSCTVEANTTYLLDMTLFVQADPAGDFKWNFTFPSSTYRFSHIGPATNSAGGSTDSTANFFVNATEGTGTSSTELGVGGLGGVAFAVHVKGRLAVGAAGGTLQFRWAQGTSSGTGTILGQGSTLHLVQVA